MKNDELKLPKTLRDDYRDLCMLRDMLRGHSTKELALKWDCTPRTVNRHIKQMSFNMMRSVFRSIQGDPEHPSTPRWTVEEFCNDSRGCLITMTDTHIAGIERTYPRIKKE